MTPSCAARRGCAEKLLPPASAPDLARQSFNVDVRCPRGAAGQFVEEACVTERDKRNVTYIVCAHTSVQHVSAAAASVRARPSMCDSRCRRKVWSASASDEAF